MPVDGPSYLVGRTDERVLAMFCSGTNYQCLWTGPNRYGGCWSGDVMGPGMVLKNYLGCFAPKKLSAETRPSAKSWRVIAVTYEFRAYLYAPLN
jgi:hypothetical protein